MPHQQLELRSEPRTAIGKGLRAIRQAGYVPANVYGRGQKSIPIQVPLKSFEQIAKHATPTTMISLTIDADTQTRAVYLQHVQWQFTKRQPFHLDFYAV